jgi:uncharacterized protein (DUF983 family)
MFDGLFTLQPTCSHCHARYERREGESIGGTMLNLCVAEMLTMGGYLTTEFTLHPPVAVQLIGWISFNIIFVLLFYRHARAIWIAAVHLFGGLTADDEQSAI